MEQQGDAATPYRTPQQIADDIPAAPRRWTWPTPSPGTRMACWVIFAVLGIDACAVVGFWPDVHRGPVSAIAAAHLIAIAVWRVVAAAP